MRALLLGKHLEEQPEEVNLLEGAVLATVTNNDFRPFDYLLENKCPMNKDQINKSIDESLQTGDWDKWRKTCDVMLKRKLVTGQAVTHVLKLAEKAGDRSFLESYKKNQHYNPITDESSDDDATSGKDASTSQEPWPAHPLPQRQPVRSPLQLQTSSYLHAPPLPLQRE
jgi:hypothetical protein